MKSFFFLPYEKVKYSEFKSKATIVQRRAFSHAKVVIVRCCSNASGAQCFTLPSTKPVKMHTTDTHANIASRTHKGGKTVAYFDLLLSTGYQGIQHIQLLFNYYNGDFDFHT